MKNTITYKMRKLIALVAMLLIGFKGFAQQDPMLSHYMFNGLFLNPAYAGSHKYFGTSFIHRNQWMGFDGAPRTNVFAIDGPIKSKTMGVGLTFANDNIGKNSRNDILLNYAYHIGINKTSKLSFGISAGLINVSRKTPFAWDGNDQALAPNSFWGPRAGFGMYYYSKKGYLGLSIPTLIGKEPSKAFDFNVEKSTFVKRHYLLTGGYLFDVGSNIILKPSFLLKYQQAAPLQADINLNALFYETFWLGASFRTGDAIVALAEYQITRQLRIGASYDYSYTKLGRLTNGSFEVMIGYDFGKDPIKAKNPRYF
jgi:type IX secretion system PorP/SprF family membrane protein